MRVRYTAAALREIDEILSYIAKDNPLAADEVAAVLRATVRRLSEYPRLAIEPTSRVFGSHPSYHIGISFSIPSIETRSWSSTSTTRRGNTLRLRLPIAHAYDQERAKGDFRLRAALAS
jgi:plasmid stabilization system protein ParE